MLKKKAKKKVFLFSRAQSNLPLDCSFCLQQQGIQPPLSLNMQGQLSFAESTFNTVAHKSGIKDAILYGGWKKKTLIWTQNDYLQRCFLLHEIDLHASVILLLLSSPFFFFFKIPSRSQQTAQMKEATPPSGALLQTLRLSTARWICMWIMVQWKDGYE